MQESEVNVLIDKQIKLLNTSFDEQKIIQKKKKIPKYMLRLVRRKKMTES
jgi:hypothetical protein